MSKGRASCCLRTPGGPTSRGLGPQSGASPESVLLPSLLIQPQDVASWCFSDPAQPDRRIDTDEARQAYETNPRERHDDKRATIRITKPQERDCLRHGSTPEKNQDPTSSKADGQTYCPHPDHAAPHRIAPRCIAAQKQIKGCRRRDRSGVPARTTAAQSIWRPGGTSQEARHGPGTASWRWTSATQPVRGFAIYPAQPILGLAWLAPCWVFGVLHFRYQRAAIANRSPDLDIGALVGCRTHGPSRPGSRAAADHATSPQPAATPPDRTIYS